MGDLHVRSEVAFGGGLWVRIKARGKELGNRGMILLEGYNMVNKWSFAEGADGNEETIRRERRWGM